MTTLEQLRNAISQPTLWEPAHCGPCEGHKVANKNAVTHRALCRLDNLIYDL